MSTDKKKRPRLNDGEAERLAKIADSVVDKKLSGLQAFYRGGFILLAFALALVFSLSIGMLFVAENKRNELLLLVQRSDVYINTTISTGETSNSTTNTSLFLTVDYKFNVSYYADALDYKPHSLRIEYNYLFSGSPEELTLIWNTNEITYLSHFIVYESDESISNLTVTKRTVVAGENHFRLVSSRNIGRKYFVVESILMDATSSGVSDEFVYDSTIRFMAYGNPLGDTTSDEDIFVFDDIAIVNSDGASKRTAETTAHIALITYGTNYQFSPNGQYIAWLSNNLADSSSRVALMVARTYSNTTSSPINYDLLVNSTSQTFAFGFSRDCNFIYFVCNCTRNVTQLYVSELDGSNPVEISRTNLTNYEGVMYSSVNRVSPLFTTDGRIIWVERILDVDSIVMRNINVTNSITKLDPIEIDDVPTGTYINSFKLTPDSRYVLYTANHNSPTRYDLYKVFLGNPLTATKLTPSRLLADVNSVQSPFFISSDSNTVVYSFGTTAGYRTYFSTPIALDGNYATLITQTPSVGVSFPVNLYNVISPDGTMVAYAVVTSTSCELYLTSIRGRVTPFRITGGSSVAGCSVTSFKWAKSYKGNYIVLHSKYNGTYPMLYLVDINNRDLTRISDNTLGHAYTKDYIVTDDGQNVIYIADERSNGRNELFINTIPITASSQLVGAVGSLTRDYTTLIGSSISGLQFRSDE
jgi:hypothetical protein